MPRTTATSVKQILLSDYDSVDEPSLIGFIETASAIVDSIIECATERGYSLTTARAELIERWLSAHFYVMSDQNYKGRSTLRASGQFQGETKMYFEASKYGQTAVSLDGSGCLSSLGSNNRNVRSIWLGRRPSAQTDYKDRD